VPASERVAVIVVHGVADQESRTSLRQVASLLANIDDDGRAAYAAFAEHLTRVPVRAVPVETTRSGKAFYSSSRRAGPQGIDIVFTEGQLEHYEGGGPDDTFETIRISGSRSTVSGPIDVDLFEMYWADLSRAGSSAWRILGELYQVLLHVGSLAKHAASASAAGDDRLSSRAYRATTALASFVLAGPIAILNLLFLVAAALVLASMLPAEWYPPMSIGVLAIGAMAVMAVALLRTAGRGLALRIGLGVLAIGAISLVAYFREFNATRLLALEVLGLSLAGCWRLLWAYRRRRPGSLWVSAAGLVLVGGRGAAAVNRGCSQPEEWFQCIAAPGFRITEDLFLVLHLCWIGFLLAFILSIASGAMHWRGLSGERRERARRAAWTARVGLAIPAVSFLLLTVALWSGLFLSLDRQERTEVREGADSVFDEPYEPYLQQWGLLEDGTYTGRTFVEQVLVSSLGPGFLLPGLLIAVAAVLSIVAMGPIVWSEVSQPPTNRHCRQFGVWLSSGFGVLRGAGRLIVLGLAAWPVAALAIPYLAPRLTGAASVEYFVTTMGLIVAASATGLMAFRGRLQGLAGGFRAPIDVLLDIDGYLREHPRDAAPRARVFARYYSLLQHVAAARPAYTKVVVIAHSQGTVITADLFRYLRLRNLSPLSVPVTFFTMGSPLRQLYARRFPDLYEWVWHDHQSTSGTLLTPDIDPNSRPNPDALGVVRWVNAYRSGDYVGRWIWRPDACPYQFEALPERAPWASISAPLPGHSRDVHGKRRELCVGAGAHTHYWDGTAPEIAVELDLLIRT
jgi:hypothetical protein